MREDKTTPLPSSGGNLNNGADKLSNIDIANIPSSDILHQPEARTLLTRPEGDTAPPEDKVVEDRTGTQRVKRYLCP